MVVKYEDWCDTDIVRNEEFTLGNFLEMKVDDVRNFLFLDRNVFDIACENRQDGTEYPPQVFFDQNVHRLKKTGIFEWEIYWSWDLAQECINRDIHLYHPEDKFWFPLDSEGYFNPVDELELLDLDPVRTEFWTQNRVHYTEFPPDTRIGWRGPLIPWEKVINLPPVLYTEPDYSHDQFVSDQLRNVICDNTGPDSSEDDENSNENSNKDSDETDV